MILGMSMFRLTGDRRDDNYCDMVCQISRSRRTAKKQFIPLALTCKPIEEDAFSTNGIKRIQFMISISLGCPEMMPEPNTTQRQKKDPGRLYKTGKMAHPWS